MTVTSQKLIRERLGWNPSFIQSLGSSGVRFVLRMIEKHDAAEARLTEHSERRGREDEVQRSA